MSAILPASAFTLDDAREVGLRKDQVYSLLEQGQVERVGRGVFMRPDEIDPRFTALAAASALHENATLCLTSALVYHDLSDVIPFGSDIALPRGTRPPAGIRHTRWHTFDPATFQIGREKIEIGREVTAAVYSAERTIIDCFRLMHQEGSDVAYEALKRWLRRKGSSPSALVKMAASFPRALPRLRQALEVLL